IRILAPADGSKIEVGNGGRNGRQCRTKYPGQTKQGQIRIKLGNGDGTGGADLGKTRERRQKRHEGFPTDQDELPAALSRHWQETGELNCISGTLFRVDQQRLGGDRAAVPLGMWTLEGRKVPSLPAPLVLRKAAPVVAELQQSQAQVEVRLCITRLQLNRPLKSDHRLG